MDKTFWKKYFFSGLALVLLFLNCNYVSANDKNVRASYGESCDKTTKCNSRSLLTCTDGVCKCLKESEMTYDKNRSKCVLLPGERCTYTAIETKDDNAQGRRWTETLDCADNAICKQDGYCGCTDNYMENSSGACVPKPGHGENCTKDDDCISTSNLICSNGKCSCNETEAVYNSYKKRCVAKVGGGSCRKYGACTENAYCYYLKYGYYSSGNMEYEGCQCVTGTTNGTDGLCYASYNSECDPKLSPCVSDLTCIDGRCSCLFTDYQNYNLTMQKCVSSLHGPCFETVGGKRLSFPCGVNMECGKPNGGAISECVCSPGFVESYNGECRKTYGSFCKSQKECDGTTGLLCKDGLCTCGDFQEYDSGLNTCLGLVGSKCSGDGKCITGAFCKPAKDNVISGTCRCIPPLSANSERKCTTEVANDMGVSTESIDGSESQNYETTSESEMSVGP